MVEPILSSITRIPSITRIIFVCFAISLLLPRCRHREQTWRSNAIRPPFQMGSRSSSLQEALEHWRRNYTQLCLRPTSTRRIRCVAIPFVSIPPVIPIRWNWSTIIISAAQFVITRHSHAVLRIVTDEPGVFALHCHMGKQTPKTPSRSTLHVFFWSSLLICAFICRVASRPWENGRCRRSTWCHSETRSSQRSCSCALNFFILLSSFVFFAGSRLIGYIFFFKPC